MKNNHLLLLSIIALLVILSWLLTNLKQDYSDLRQREIRMRKIGHEILLHSGDTNSRVLPVEHLSDEKFRLVFEKPFTFKTDSLVSIIRKSLFVKGTSPDYIVNVLNCSDAAIVYAYSVSSLKEANVIPCTNRKQPVDCYVITIEFVETSVEIKKHAAAIAAFALVLLCPIAAWRYRKKTAITMPKEKNVTWISIGKFRFDPSKKMLVFSEATIHLTAKENNILFIFAKNPNQVIDRARLQKEIWEDDGIIVGRSLDMFISKLRKKLEPDPAVQLVNIHGKGYKLQIESFQN